MDAIIVPVGGGGLIAGVAVAAKNMNPDVKIIVSLHSSFIFTHTPVLFSLVMFM